jgi:formylglycine-generating enzyme required for sulfatase activity
VLDTSRHPLVTGCPPDWASAWGQDRFGVWVAFEYQGVSQRLRWAPPGRFWMGSPEAEAGRYHDEGPRHEVTLSWGYWLGDTACSQALWEAVMRKNPSRFEGGERPVDQVSFEDVQRFLERLNNLVPGLALTLPTEAQWEYCCRAGTETPFSLGEDITVEEVNYDGNHPYARGRKGRYRQETVAVGSLPPNPWGFYEMHGNVWEWCRDWQRTYEAVPVQDPLGSAEPGGVRVIRGGSWFSNARYVRCAYRDWGGPGLRDAYLGFRCARAQQYASAGRLGV